MNKLQRNVWLLVAIAAAISITLFTLSYIVTEPWRMLPDIGGDGAKNNFTYLYHSLYGRGYWFEGMNYPYGEHIVFTDGQPIISVLLTHFKGVTTGEALTILWWLTGLSYVLAIVFIYKILAWFKVAPLPAIIFAGLIVVCSPQLFCLKGHYALGYMCIAPMLFYWTIMYHEQVKWRYCAYIFFTGVIAAFLHPYFMAMILVWVMSYAAGYFIFTKQRLVAKLRHVLPLMVSAIGVFLLVAIVMKVTDPLKDRPVMPFKATDMYTTLGLIFSSTYSPLWWHAIHRGIVPRASAGGEGFTYVGFVTAATVCLSLLFFVIRKLRNKQPAHVAPPVFSPIWLFAAFVILLLAMGIPFIWKMEWLMDYISVFRQFRALGRFSWIFYYVITIYSVVVLYSWFAALIEKKKGFWGYSLLVFSISIWAYEASGCVTFSRQLSREAAYHYDMMYSKNEENWASFLKEKQFTGTDFQAIILLPFMHIGTEKIWIGDPGWLITMGTKAALQLRLPVVDVMMSRSSWSVAQKQVKLVAGPFADKPMLRDAKSDKPFLLYYMDKDTLAIDQNYLLAASDFIGDFSGGKVYACYPRRLVANDRKYADSVLRILPYIRSADTCIGDNGNAYINHFDEGNAVAHLFGKGAAVAIKPDTGSIATIPLNEMKDSVAYEFSCWFLLSKDDYASPGVELQCLDGAGKEIKIINVMTKESVDSHDMWFRASKYFYVPAGCRYIKCILHNTPNPSYKAMDEMQLRPVDALIISKAADGSVMANNHLLKQ